MKAREVKGRRRKERGPGANLRGRPWAERLPSLGPMSRLLRRCPCLAEAAEAQHLASALMQEGGWISGQASETRGRGGDGGQAETREVEVG